MGLMSWLRGGSEPGPKQSTTEAGPKQDRLQVDRKREVSEIAGMNGAVEVQRPGEYSVFEFGSAMSTADKVTLSGYCPVSDELEPCRWQIVSSTDANAPRFRILF